MRWRVLIPYTLLALGACTGPIFYQAPPCSGEIADPSAATFRQLHVRALLTHEGREQRHEVVVDSAPGRITAVGLTPMGTVAYRLSHDPERITVENRIGRALGLDPELAYDAIVHGVLVPQGDAPEPRAVDAGGRISITRDECRYHAQLMVVSDRRARAPDAPPAP